MLKPTKFIRHAVKFMKKYNLIHLSCIDKDTNGYTTVFYITLGYAENHETVTLTEYRDDELIDEEHYKL